MRSRDWDRINAKYLAIFQRLEAAGADAAILGCTQLPILLKEYPTAWPTLSTVDLHIDMAVKFILG